ncbi:hypothetical protein NC651_020967 [Populus alba x Populus x berolinensis]|nr:hypothetical protein NC651_020967 [Populus alba x Populus x berolinensis]
MPFQRYLSRCILLSGMFRHKRIRISQENLKVNNNLRSKFKRITGIASQEHTVAGVEVYGINSSREN